MTDTITITIGNNWRLYWGNGPLPAGARAIGTVKRETGDTGALIAMPAGVLSQGSAGALRSLPRAASTALAREQIKRLLADTTRELLAVTLGVSVSAIDHWTSGRRTPSRSTQHLIDRVWQEREQ